MQDAAGHVFSTTYDLDGQVQSVALGGQTITSYVYGSTAGTVTYGQPVSLTDSLSSPAVTQTFTYGTSGGALGQPISVNEQRGTDSYTVSYSYLTSGERATATYVTPQSTRKWMYSDYEPVGEPTDPKRVFQTLTLIDNTSGSPTTEEFHYAYDTAGRLREAAFAQSPDAAYTPAAGFSYYTSDHKAATRARTENVYDPAGRILSTATYWDTLGAAGYASTGILANSCLYERFDGTQNYNGTLNRGLKTTSSFYDTTSGFTTPQRTEQYGYDASLDYLTSADYGDGLPNQQQSWTYDAAGNRNDCVADNLNRPLSLGGVSVTSDVLGNRLTKGAVSYGWDSLNRMVSYTDSSSVTTNYSYRADGMRTKKSNVNGQTVFRYDGQMGVQDVEALTSGAVTKFTDSALGARGIDAMYVTQNNVTTASYPLYDAHGNMAATLSVSGGTYSVANKRTLDAWGVTRSGSGLAGSYCANLGHKQDDESGLVYMRARYYEQQTGRFLSLDAKRQGSNWYEYCSNLPTQGLDRDGNYGESESFIVGLLGTIAGAAMSITGAIVAFFGLLFLCAWIIGDSLATKCGLENSSSCDPGDRASTFKICNLLISAVVGGVGVAIAAVGYGKSVLGEAFGAVLAYGGICEAFIAYMNLPEGP